MSHFESSDHDWYEQEADDDFGKQEEPRSPSTNPPEQQQQPAIRSKAPFDAMEADEQSDDGPDTFEVHNSHVQTVAASTVSTHEKQQRPQSRASHRSSSPIEQAETAAAHEAPAREAAQVGMNNFTRTEWQAHLDLLSRQVQEETDGKERPSSSPPARTQQRPRSAERVNSARQSRPSSSYGPKSPNSAPNQIARLRKQIQLNNTENGSNGLSRRSPTKCNPGGFGDAYLMNVELKLKKKKVPKQIYAEPEAMYMEILQLKEQLSQSRDNAKKLSAELSRTAREKLKVEKQVAELLRLQSVVESDGRRFEAILNDLNLMKSMKAKIRSMEKEIEDKNEEIRQIKQDSRFTRVKELEIELKTYFNEVRRLQKIIEQCDERV